MKMFGAAISWAILISPLAAAAIVIHAARSGRRANGELMLAILIALGGGLFWMFLATAFALQSGHAWVVWLSWGFIAVVVCSASAMAKVKLLEWGIVIFVLYIFRELPYESKIKQEPRNAVPVSNPVEAGTSPQLTPRIPSEPGTARSSGRSLEE